MRIAPLRARKALRRSPMRRRLRSTTYSRRERDFDFMGWVKQQPCVVRSWPPASRAVGGHCATPCYGPIEADHMGDRGLGQKADDDTCVPMCSQHHRERTDHTGTFRPLTRDELRAWRAAAIQRTQKAWSNR